MWAGKQDRGRGGNVTLWAKHLQTPLPTHSLDAITTIDKQVRVSERKMKNVRANGSEQGRNTAPTTYKLSWSSPTFNPLPPSRAGED